MVFFGVCLICQSIRAKIHEKRKQRDTQTVFTLENDITLPFIGFFQIEVRMRENLISLAYTGIGVSWRNLKQFPIFIPILN